MAPKRKAPSATQSQATKKNKPSPGKLRRVEDLFAAVPASSKPSKKTAQDLIGSSCTLKPQDGHSDPWTDTYAPTSRAQLAVHKKKVEELDNWFKGALEGRLTKDARMPRCCCISGPPGCGRSTTVNVLAKENACEVNYWSFPAPTLWGETKHIGGAGYTSKMAEFEAFVDRAKLKSLPFTHVSSDPSGPPCSQIASTLPRGDAKESAQSSQSSQKAGSSTAAVKQQSVLVVSDFPHLHNADARARFKESLAALVATSEAPTIILVTDSGRTATAEPVSDGPGTKYCRLEELIVETVKEAGAPHISFNPLTERMCIKEANRVLKDARHDVPEADVRALVQEVHCDLRNAIQALQLRLVGQKQKAKGAGAKGSKNKKAAGKAADVDMHGRDMGLSFFHALGRILYNKRFNALGEQIKVGQQEHGDDGKPAEQGQPLMPAEEVVSRSGLGAQVITSFLFEHYVHMIAPEAIEDAAASAEKFSDAIFMLGRGSHDTGTFGSQWVDPEHATTCPADAVAGTVACRGYMWANQHPAPRKWHALGRPKNGAVGRAVVQNHAELAERAAMGRSEMEAAQVFAVQVVPYSRLMATMCPGHQCARWLPIKWKKWWNNSVVEEYGGGVECARPGAQPDAVQEMVEDPIED